MVSLFIDMASAGETVEKVLLWVAASLIVFDIYLYLNETSGDTISNILHKWVYRNRLIFITYLWGVLAGHFFLGVEDPPFEDNLKSLSVVLGIALALLLFGLFHKKNENWVKPYHQTFLFIFGVVIGHYFWSLKF